MADIDVQRKGPSIWPWIIGLLVLALLIWAVAEMVDTDEAEVAETEMVEPVPPVAEVPAPMPMEETGAMLPVTEIMTNPQAWQGRTISGAVQVTEAPTQRGFWAEQSGQRIFAIIQNVPAGQPLTVAPGQTVMISNARVQTDPAGLPADLDAQTRQLVQGERVFLVVDHANLRPSGTLAQPGATPGQTQPGRTQPGQMSPSQSQPGTPSPTAPGTTPSPTQPMQQGAPRTQPMPNGN